MDRSPKELASGLGRESILTSNMGSKSKLFSLLLIGPLVEMGWEGASDPCRMKLAEVGMAAARSGEIF